MAVPYINAATGRPISDNRQPGYGAGLGGIQQFGYGNPYGPYSFLPGAQRPGSTSATSSTTASSGPTASAESWLNSVLSGQNLPFSPQTQAAQLTQQTDMSAAAESAQNQQLGNMAAAGGASRFDPSFQGAKAANFAQRQGRNMQAAGDIAAKAGQANFGAQMQAAGQLNQNQLTREGFQHGMQNQALGFMPWNQSGGGRMNNFNYGAGLTPGPYFSL